jgi:hypothetical protein
MKITLSQDELIAAVRAWLEQAGHPATGVSITLCSTRPRGSDAPVFSAEVEDAPKQTPARRTE